jgi:hypothetical protein
VRLTSHDEQGGNVAIDTKQNVSLQIIADHNGSLRVVVMTRGMAHKCYVVSGTESQVRSASRHERTGSIAEATYVAMIASSICLCGLPMIVGVFVVEYRRGADMDPAPVAKADPLEFRSAMRYCGE